MDEQHSFEQLAWSNEELDWSDCMNKPSSDEQKYGSADRPPKFWLDSETKAGPGNSLITSVRGHYGLQ